MIKYKFISHTADLKIRVYGENLTDVIKNILFVLSDYWAPSLTKTKVKTKLKITGVNLDDILIDFIAEVINKTYVKKAIFKSFKKKKIIDTLIEGELIGYKFTSLSKDIKAVTYHQARLKKIKNKFIFDFIIDI